MEAIDYDKLADALAERMSKTPPIEKVVWGVKECASYLRVSERHFSDRISKHHKFPRAITLPIDGKRRTHPKWFAGEIIAWAEKQR